MVLDHDPVSIIPPFLLAASSASSVLYTAAQALSSVRAGVGAGFQILIQGQDAFKLLSTPLTTNHTRRWTYQGSLPRLFQAQITATVLVTPTTVGRHTRQGFSCPSPWYRLRGCTILQPITDPPSPPPHRQGIQSRWGVSSHFLRDHQASEQCFL